MGFLRLALVAVLALTACGDEDADVASDDDAPTTTGGGVPDDTVYETTATVLESPDHGPQLCLGGVAESYPPQCGGPDIVGWDWSTVQAESASGTTWGTYSLTGTWDGETFTVTGPVGEPEPYDDGGATDFSTPCEEPEGGWTVVDEATADDAGLAAAQEYAQGQPDFGGLWVDQSINPASGELGMNDPTKLILNVKFTGDLERHEAELRDRFGGPLCVVETDRTEAELRRLQDDLYEELGAHFASVDIVRGVVEFGVVVADPTLQAELDDAHGAGVVELIGSLRPVDG